MTTRTEVELVLDRYLAEGAETVPDHVVDAALDEIEHTTQRRALRVPWRVPVMSLPLRLAAAAVVILAVGLGAMSFLGRAPANVGPRMSQPTPTPTTSPSPTAVATTMHTSELYGYVVEMPSEFVASAARNPWPHGAPYSPVSPWADRYDNGADNLLAIASQTLDGSAPGEWLDTYMTTADARTGDVCGDDSPENWQPIELAGFQGRRYAGTCTDEAGSSFVLEQVVARESDGWVFIWEAPAGSDAEAIQSFEEVLSTFRFPE